MSSQDEENHTEDYDKEFEGVEYSKVTKDVVRSLTQTSWKYYLALGITFLFLLAGAGVYYYQTRWGLGVWGTNEPIYWGLDIPNFIFWIGLSHSGTLLSAILLLTRSNWRKPIYRSAEAMTFFALVTAQVVILTHLARPWRAFYAMPYPNIRTLWTNLRSALSWDIVAISTYMTLSFLFLYVGTIPDFAAARDHTTGWRKKFYTVLSLGWKGSDREWRHLHRAYILLAAFVVPLAASVHSVVGWDWAVTINPGMHSTIFAPYFVAGAIFSGIAGVVIIMILVRKFLRFQEYIKISHIERLAKMLLVLSLAWSFINIFEIVIPWLKEANFELMTVASKWRGSYAPLYWTMLTVNGVFPLAMFSKRVRTSLPAMFFIAAGVELGMYLERVLIIIPGQNIGHLPATWSSYIPSWVELALTAWTFSVFTFLFLIFVKLVPSLSIYEVKELLRVPRRSKMVLAANPVSSSQGGSALDQRSDSKTHGSGGDPELATEGKDKAKSSREEEE